MKVWWSDGIWKINLSHQEQGELCLQRGFPLSFLLTGLMNLHFPSTPDANPEVLTKRTTAPSLRGVGDASWDISLMRDIDISTLTSAQLNLTGCRCHSAFCSTDKSTESSGGESIPIFHFLILITAVLGNTKPALLNSTKCAASKLLLKQKQTCRSKI